MKLDYTAIDDIITFDLEINSENVVNLIENCQKTIHAKPECKILIYFSTIGGSFSHAELLLKYLNDNNKNIIMCAFHQISSAGFYIFYNFIGEKDIVDHTYATMHYGDRMSSFRDLQDEESFDFFMANEIKIKMDEAVDLLFTRLKIQRKNIKIMKSGKDVFFNTEELRKFLAIKH